MAGLTRRVQGVLEIVVVNSVSARLEWREEEIEYPGKPRQTDHGDEPSDLLEAGGDLGRRDNPEWRDPDEEDNERAEYRKGHRKNGDGDDKTDQRKAQ